MCTVCHNDHEEGRHLLHASLLGNLGIKYYKGSNVFIPNERLSLGFFSETLKVMID